MPLEIFDGFAGDAVERFYGVGGVARTAYIFWVVKQRVQVFPSGSTKNG